MFSATSETQVVTCLQIVLAYETFYLLQDPAVLQVALITFRRRGAVDDETDVCDKTDNQKIKFQDHKMQ